MKLNQDKTKIQETLRQWRIQRPYETTHKIHRNTNKL
jgi:hypothetical protein